MTAASNNVSAGGTVFRLNQDGGGYQTLLGLPTNGVNLKTYARVGVLIQASDGALYATTDGGGTNAVGSLFKLLPNGGSYLELHSFGSSATDGQRAAALVECDDGLLYGTTVYGGEQGYGTVFAVGKDGGNYHVVHSFTTNSSGAIYPDRHLIQGSDGALYGVTQAGAAANRGAIFTIHKDGSGYAVLCSIGSVAAYQRGVFGFFEGLDHSLYCANYVGWSNWGSVFRVNKDGTGWTELFTAARNWPGWLNGSSFGSLIQSSDGTFYGTTIIGGGQDLGTVFRLWPAQTPDLAAPQHFATASVLIFNGQAGSRYQILRSTDLRSWSTINTITMPSAGTYTNVDNAPPSAGAFYRAAWMP